MGEVACLRGEEKMELKNVTMEIGDGRTDERTSEYIYCFLMFLHNLVFVFVLGQK